MSSFKIKGLDDLSKKIENLSGKYNAEEIFDSQFMSKYTRFSSFNEMLNYSGFAQDFDNIPEEDWNYFVAETTKFKNREEMKNKGGIEFATKKLF